MIDLELYRSFVKIYQSKTLSKASESLPLSQPALSQHLQSLENYIGKELFVRTPRQLIPTETAKELYANIIGAIELLENAERSFRRKEIQKNRSLKIGGPVEFLTCFQNSFIAKHLQKIEFIFGEYTQLVPLLENNSIDVLVATKETKSTTQFSKFVYEENFILVSGNRNLEKKLKEVSYKPKEVETILKKETWIAYDHSLSIIRRFWKLNFEKRPEISPSCILPNLFSILDALENSNSVSIVPEYVFAFWKKNRKTKLQKIWKDSVKATNKIFLNCLTTNSEAAEWISQIPEGDLSQIFPR